MNGRDDVFVYWVEGTSIVVAGNNNQVVFYDEDGGEEQNFDMSETPDGNGIQPHTYMYVCMYVCISRGL